MISNFFKIKLNRLMKTSVVLKPVGLYLVWTHKTLLRNKMCSAFSNFIRTVNLQNTCVIISFLYLVSCIYNDIDITCLLHSYLLFIMQYTHTKRLKDDTRNTKLFFGYTYKIFTLLRYNLLYVLLTILSHGT